MQPSARSDEDLLAAGDPDSFATFYRRHVDAILAYLMRRTRDAEAAADLTAETFAAALLARRRFRAGGPPARAWLFGIAHNKLVDWQRRARSEDRARRRLAMERIELTPGDRAALERMAADAEIVRLVEELPPDQGHAVRQRFLEGRDYDAIAESLGVSEPVVRKRVSRGLAAMRARLRGRG